MKRIKYLRKTQTTADGILWEVIRGSLLGEKFRRQYEVRKYILDFYCPKYRIGIEIDGDVHKMKSVNYKDLLRERILESAGILVLRFSNIEVYNNINGVLKKIVEAIVLKREN